MPAPSAETVRAATKAVLARPEFQPETDPFQRLRDWLEGMGQLDPHVPAVLGWLLLLVCTGIICYVLATLLAPGKATAAARPRTAASRLQVLEGVGETVEQAWARARAALAAGDVRQGLWIAHRLLLLRLSEEGALRFTPAKTNADYLHECADPLLRDLTGAYEEAVYAQRAVEFQRAAELLDAVASR